MAIFVNEKKMVESNIFQYEEKLKSPMARFLDTTPTFVTYYHINADETTTDAGYKDVASIVGFRSPIKFKKIENFPMYGIEQIVLQLQDQDQGLDTEYSNDAIILPNTIKPLENDFFMIPYLHDVYLFRITEISYDNIMPDNFYKVNFQLEYLEQEKVDAIEKQANESYTCILDNIGTENKCIIETDTMTKIKVIEEMYSDMANTYMTLFYDERHNCLIGDLGAGTRLYDPYMNEFANKHSLFNRKNNLKTVLFTNQLEDKTHRLKYEKSVYRFIERRDYSRVHNFKFTYFQGSAYHETSFYRWADTTVQVLDIPSVIPSETFDIFSDEFVMSIKTNGFTQSKHAELIQKFVRDKNMSINDIPLDLNEELLDLNNSLEVFFITPIIMYIIQTVVNDAINIKK
jgi:hypothetical protein